MGKRCTRHNQFPDRNEQCVVGTSVRLMLGNITGVIVDVVLDTSHSRIQAVVIAFDMGFGETMLYEAVSWNLLHPCVGGFVLSGTMEEESDQLSETLHTSSVAYGGNSTDLTGEFLPTPLSARVH
jgi:hypothetical protein